MAAPSRNAEHCFHCGDALPAARTWLARAGGEDRKVCCPGCKAVAEFIDGSDLGAYYRFRSAPPDGTIPRPRTRAFTEYDGDDLRSRYVHEQAGSAEATIDIGGMYCSACAWLLDNALSQHAGVRSVDVNPATRRAVIAWNIDALPFSGLLGAIAAIGFEPQPVGAAQRDTAPDGDYRRALKRLLVAAAAGMQVMMFAVAMYAGDYFGIEPSVERFLRAVSLLVTLPIVFYSARPFFESAWRGIRARLPGMDLPVSIAIAAAFCASAWAVWTNRGDVYFDSIAMFVLFLSTSRFLEMRARHRAEDFGLALARLLPDSATRVIGGVQETVALDRLRAGDTLVIRPGDVIPADGRVVSGTLTVDESMLTGESQPVVRAPGMQACAGGTNRAGSAHVAVTRTGASTRLAEIGRLLERARADRPPLVVLADRIAARFVIAVLLIATLTGLAWTAIDPARVFEIVLATLVVTCPCALALATPAAIAAATSRLASDGLLLTRSRILDVLRPGATIVFDKTGTLTRGRPALTRTRLLSGRGDQDAGYCLALAAAMERASEHVLARAFEERPDLPDLAVADATPESGRGVAATLDGVRIRIGNRGYVRELAGNVPRLDEGPGTHVYLGSESGWLAEFIIDDELRADAMTAVRALHDLGFETAIASGDRAPAVARVAERLGIGDWHAELSPAAKLDFVAKRRRAGRPVIMVGDGINDAPVLAAADASVALDAGTAIARASADAIALGERLMSIVDAADVAHRTRVVVRQNIAWAIAYNLTAVPLAVTGLLSPWMAALGMSLSSLIVVLNALRLHGHRALRTKARSADRTLAQSAAA